LRCERKIVCGKFSGTREEAAQAVFLISYYLPGDAGNATTLKLMRILGYFLFSIT
jgi:hypothetical protein